MTALRRPKVLLPSPISAFARRIARLTVATPLAADVGVRLRERMAALAVCQARQPVRRTPNGEVDVVFTRCNRAEVGGIDAGWNAALVMELVAFGYRANEKLVGEAVGSDIGAAVAGLEVSVACLVGRRGPQPTRLGLSDLCPESLLRRYTLGERHRPSFRRGLALVGPPGGNPVAPLYLRVVT